MGLISREPGPQDAAIVEELLGELTRNLTETQQQILQLKLMGFTNVEVSEQLNRSERTVYRLLGQLRSRMQKIASEDAPV